MPKPYYVVSHNGRVLYSTIYEGEQQRRRQGSWGSPSAIEWATKHYKERGVVCEIHAIGA